MAPPALLFSAFFLLRFQTPPKKADCSASILVSVRNEKDAIVACLEALTAQDFRRGRLQIVVADDNSSDGTLERIRSFADKASVAMHVIQNSNPDKYASSKKAALEAAVEKATGDILLFTDADCHPGKAWAKSMISFFDDSVGMVAGFSPQRAPTGLWSEIMQLDAAAAAFVAAGTIAIGRGVTCTGRNLAVRRQALLDIGGYEALPDSLSGDDDFVLHKITRHPRWKAKYAFAPHAVVPADGPQNLRCFLQQKRRHLSAGKDYRLFSQFVFAVFHLANFAIWLCPLMALYFRAPLYLLPFVIKMIVDYGCLSWFFRKFQVKVSPKAFLLWEPLFLFYNVFIGPTSFWGKLKWRDDDCQKQKVTL